MFLENEVKDEGIWQWIFGINQNVSAFRMTAEQSIQTILSFANYLFLFLSANLVRTSRTHLQTPSTMISIHICITESQFQLQTSPCEDTQGDIQQVLLSLTTKRHFLPKPQGSHIYDQYIDKVEQIVNLQKIRSVELQIHTRSPLESDPAETCLVFQNLLSRLKSHRFITTFMAITPFSLDNMILFYSTQWKFLLTLELKACNLSHQAMKILSKCHLGHLKLLDCSFNPMGNKGLKHLCGSNLRNIYKLNIFDINVTADAIRYLAKLLVPKLGSLSTTFTSVSSPQLAQLMAFKRFRYMGIQLCMDFSRSSGLVYYNLIAKLANFVEEVEKVRQRARMVDMERGNFQNEFGYLVAETYRSKIIFFQYDVDN